MGNHSIGAAYVAIVETALDRRKPGETALEILNMAADKSGICGADAEFDDALDTDQPTGRLIFEAFAPNGVDDIPAYDLANETGTVDFDTLYDATYGAFRKLYNLC